MVRLMENLSLLIIIGSLCINCNNPESSKIEKEYQSESKINEGLSDQENETNKNYCYRNEYPFPDNPEDKDVLELNIETIGDTVKGTYNWLPVFKDQRKGLIEGTKIDDVIEGKYVFMQEGIRDTATIGITLKGGKAIIDGKPPELGLAATIVKVDCNN